MVSIASYRGPGMAGGVSTALSTLWRLVGDKAENWYFVCSKTDSIKRSQANGKSFAESFLNPDLVKDHYRYCNDFIWPVMHDLPEHATYRQFDRERYCQFNSQFARVIEENRRRVDSSCFIQDYQLALTSKNFGGPKQIFWHIPWPKNVEPQYVEPIMEIASGLLNCDSVGFHTREYADNFVAFVNKYFPGFSSSTFRRERVNPLRTVSNSGSNADEASNEIHRGRVRAIVYNSYSFKLTRVVVAPLGLDLDYWKENRESSRLIDHKLHDMGLASDSYILSVDRADYTKGVYQRMAAIDHFLEKYPQHRGDVKFVQICGKTRSGLGAFETYWDKSRNLADSVNERWGDGNWQPIHWIDTPMNTKMLAGCYRNAKAMLVNPVRDGLNLTAKEFIACQAENPGVLALSPGAGAWHEIGEWAVEASPESSDSLADAIHESLRLSHSERSSRADAIMQRLEENTLHDWCNFFSGQIGSKSTSPQAQTVARSSLARRYAKYANRRLSLNSQATDSISMSK